MAKPQNQAAANQILQKAQRGLPQGPTELRNPPTFMEEVYGRGKAAAKNLLSQAKGVARGAVSDVFGTPGDIMQIASEAQPLAPGVSPAASWILRKKYDIPGEEYDAGPLKTSEQIAEPLRKEGILKKEESELPGVELAGAMLRPDVTDLGTLAKYMAIGGAGILLKAPDDVAKAAATMEKKGVSPNQIWNQLKVFREVKPGTGGEWMTEVSDMPLQVKVDKLKWEPDVKDPEKGGHFYGKAGEVIDHPELFEKMPELKDENIYFTSDQLAEPGIGGWHRGDIQTITVYAADSAQPQRGNLYRKLEQSNQNRRELKDNVDDLSFKTFDWLKPTENGLDAAEIKKAADQIRQGKPTIIDRTFEEQATVELSRSLEQLAEEEANHARIAKEIENLRGAPEISDDKISTLVHELQHAEQSMRKAGDEATGGLGGGPRGGMPKRAWGIALEAIENIPREHGMTLDKMVENAYAFDASVEKSRALNDLSYLLWLEDFKKSPNPTRQARLIRNNGIFSTSDLSGRLGSPPKPSKKEEYAQWLRNAADMLQDMIIAKYDFSGGTPLSQKLGNEIGFEQLKRLRNQPREGSYDGSTPSEFPRLLQDEFAKIAEGIPDGEKSQLFDLFVQAVNDRVNLRGGGLPDIPRNEVKNAISRERRKIEKLRPAKLAKSEMRTANELLQVRYQGFTGPHKEASDFETYKLLAGEAQARLVQARLANEVEIKRLKALQEAGETTVKLPEPRYDPNLRQMTSEMPIDERISMLEDYRAGIPTREGEFGYDVPKSQMYFLRQHPGNRVRIAENLLKKRNVQ